MPQKPLSALTPAVDATRSWTSRPAIGAALIVAAVLLAWSNSLSAPFAFDDHASILDNPTIRHLWPPDWLHPPFATGETVGGRPVLNFTFALNHALGGLDPQGYRLLNLLIHACSGLLLWGILRRTPAAGGAGVSLAAAILWTVHPLHTAAVTYVVQRAESLAGLLVLLALYCFIRGALDQTRGRGWFALAVAAAFLGVGTKETAAIVPPLALAYDRAFLAGTFRSAWRRRGGVHAALFATWLPLAALVLAGQGRGGSAGWASEANPWAYFLTQCEAIVAYLRLALWPASQVFDYGTPLVLGFGEVWPEFFLLVGLAGAAAWSICRNRPAGFLGAAFFLCLAPSSSLFPVATQTMAEHRMYLALAAPIVLLCSGVRRWAPAAPRLLPASVAVAAALALAAATFARNRVYRSDLTLWGETAARVPDNPRAHHNLGLALAAAGRVDEAAAEFRWAIELHPHHAFAHFGLGTVLLGKRQWNEAAAHFETALAAEPGHVGSHVGLGAALTHLGRPDRAMEHYRAAVDADPLAHDARTNLAALLIDAGRAAEADPLLRQVLAADPAMAEAHLQLGRALEQSGSIGAAESSYRQAAELRPDLAAAQLALGNVLVRRGATREAEAPLRAAATLEPESTASRYAWGNWLANARRLEEAIKEYEAALAIDPQHVPARNNLANCQLFTGRLAEAIANYESVLRARPNDPSVLQNLAVAREIQQSRSPAGR